METRSVVIDLLMKRGLRRNLDKILCGLVEGPRATNTKIRACGFNQVFRVRERFTLGQPRDTGEGGFGQSVALIDVKNCEAFEKRHRVGVVACFLRAFAFALRNETVGIENRCSLLALADASAERESLAESEPVLPAI